MSEHANLGAFEACGAGPSTKYKFTGSSEDIPDADGSDEESEESEESDDEEV
jgi:hypothetical protein